MALNPSTQGYPGSPTGSLDRSKPLRTGLSTQVLIKIDGIYIGAIQRFAPSEERPLQRVTEVGTDAVVEIVPNAPATVTLTASRLVFDRKTVMDALGARGFRHIHAQTQPFDIEVHNFNIMAVDQIGFNKADLSTATELITTYVNCWLQRYEYTYEQSNYLITENVTIWPEAVYDNTAPDFGNDVEKALNTNSAASGASWIPIMRGSTSIPTQN